MVGYASQSVGLGPAIVLFACLASGLMIAMLLILPETRGRSLAAGGGKLASHSRHDGGACQPAKKVNG